MVSSIERLITKALFFITHTYNFTGGNTQSGAFNVTVADRAGNSNSAAFTLVKDTTAPTLDSVDVPSTSGLAIPISWTAADSESGVRDFDIEVKQGSGSWTALFNDLAATQTSYIGQPGETYTFRVRARDNVYRFWILDLRFTIDDEAPSGLDNPKS